MSNLSELKTLLSGIGGTPLASDTNDETIGKIASLAPEKMLPTVSTSDSGKVLTVNSSGEWEPSSGGGGGGVLVVNGTIDGNTMTLNKTYAEIVSADFAVLHYEFQQGAEEIDALTAFGLVDVDLYGVQFKNTMYTCNSEDGYPSYTTGGGGGV